MMMTMFCPSDYSDQHQGRKITWKTKLTCVETDRGGSLDRGEDEAGE